MGRFHTIRKKLPHKSVYLNDFEDISVRLKPEDKSEFYARTKGSSKEQPIHSSTDIVTWALLEDIEKIKGE